MKEKTIKSWKLLDHQWINFIASTRDCYIVEHFWRFRRDPVTDRIISPSWNNLNNFNLEYPPSWKNSSTRQALPLLCYFLCALHIRTTLARERLTKNYYISFYDTRNFYTLFSIALQIRLFCLQWRKVIRTSKLSLTHYFFFSFLIYTQ